MNIKKSTVDVSKVNYLTNGELVANQYAVKSVTSAMVILTVIWILNVLNIFMVDITTTTRCFISSVVVYVIGLLVCKINDMSKE